MWGDEFGMCTDQLRHRLDGQHRRRPAVRDGLGRSAVRLQTRSGPQPASCAASSPALDEARVGPCGAARPRPGDRARPAPPTGHRRRPASVAGSRTRRRRRRRWSRRPVGPGTSTAGTAKLPPSRTVTRLPWAPSMTTTTRARPRSSTSATTSPPRRPPRREPDTKTRSAAYAKGRWCGLLPSQSCRSVEVVRPRPGRVLERRRPSTA